MYEDKSCVALNWLIYKGGAMNVVFRKLDLNPIRFILLIQGECPEIAKTCLYDT